MALRLHNDATCIFKCISDISGIKQSGISINSERESFPGFDSIDCSHLAVYGYVKLSSLFPWPCHSCIQGTL